MRNATIGLLAVALLLSSGCASGGAKLLPTATLEPSARQIIEHSNQAMNALRSVRVATEVRPAIGPDINASWKEVDELVSPNRGHMLMTSLDGQFQSEKIAIDDAGWSRNEAGGAWQTGQYAVTPFAWPNFHRLEPPTGILDETLQVAEPSLLREETVGGHTAWVVSYSYQEPSVEGPFDVFATEWIEQGTYLLLRHEHYDNDPYGVQARVTDIYSGFNAQLSIEPPA